MGEEPNLVPRENLEIKPGIILITRAGPRTRVGVCCLVKKVESKLMICDKVYRLVPNIEKIHPEYLEIMLNTPTILDQIENLKSGISDSGLNLTQTKFKELKIPAPKMHLQKKMVNKVYHKWAYCDRALKNIEKENAKAQVLKQSILKSAFSGNLVPQDSNDEPASVLLERIKKEKVKLEAKIKISKKRPTKKVQS